MFMNKSESIQAITNVNPPPNQSPANAQATKTGQHTPGPWEARSRSCSDSSLVVKDSQFDEICTIRDRLERVYGPKNDRDIANTNLIASAPDLLAALQAIEARLDRWRISGIESGQLGRDKDWKELCTQARAAIAKAFLTPLPARSTHVI